MRPSRSRRRLHRWWLPWLVGVLTVAALPRLLWLDSYPPGLFYDPASEAVDAVAIQAGARPVFLPANNGREPLFVYLMALVFEVTGPTVAGLRATSALLGLAGVGLAFVWARDWFGPRVALLTAALMGASLWHVALSRFGTRSILLPVVEPLLVLLVWRAVRSGRRVTWASAGLVLGIGGYTYLSFRLFPPVVVGTVVAALVATRTGRARAARVWAGQARPDRVGGLQAHAARPWSANLASCALGAAVMLLVGGLVVAPLAAYFVSHPEDIGGRVGQVSLASERDPLARIGTSLADTLGMFVVRGDHFPFFNLPDRPVFDLLVGPFFVVGLVVALRHVRRPRYALLLFWIAVMLVPGILSVGAPNYQRTVGIMPAIFVLPALGLTTTVAWLGRRWRHRYALAAWWRRVALPACGLVVVASSALTARAYFVDLLDAPNVSDWYETDVAALGAYARELPADAQVYALIGALPDVAWAGHAHPTLTFLGRRDVRAFETENIAIADTEQRPAVYLIPDPDGLAWQSILPPGLATWPVDPFTGRRLLSLAVPVGAALRPETAVQARWAGDIQLVGSTLIRAGGDWPSELVLYWRPLAGDPDGPERGTPGRYVVSMLDGNGKDQIVARIPMHSLGCPRSVCGDLSALARRVFLDPPAASMPPPYTYRVRVLDGDGTVVQAVDADGRRINPVVRVARIDARPAGR